MYAPQISTDRPSTMLRKTFRPAKALPQQPRIVPDKEYYFSVYVPNLGNGPSGSINGDSLIASLNNSFAGGEFHAITDDCGKVVLPTATLFFCPQELLPESFA